VILLSLSLIARRRRRNINQPLFFFLSFFYVCRFGNMPSVAFSQSRRNYKSGTRWRFAVMVMCGYADPMTCNFTNGASINYRRGAHCLLAANYAWQSSHQSGFVCDEIFAGRQAASNHNCLLTPLDCCRVSSALG